jgi:glycosyltransferase involved in cell wall biosynthesis/predicted metal-dependent phosphoesterase TrpH
MRIDFHVHSKHSLRPAQWLLQKIGCPESFTDPMQVYQVAISRGMTHVTITDHNSINGALEIAHLPNTFMGEEITTYFPEDRCKLHVLAYDIDEAQHDQIQHLRANVFELVAYLQQEKIFHMTAHPLYAINDRLSMTHVEQLLLLFKNFELNGARNSRENHCLRALVNALGPDHLERLVEKHNMTPQFNDPWRKRFFGGSDDHSSINIARAYTQIDGVDSLTSFLKDPLQGQLRVVSQAATPKTMAHNLYGIAYQFYRSKFTLARYTDKDPLMRFLDRSLRTDPTDGSGIFSKLYLFWNGRRQRRIKKPVSDSLMGLLRHETRRLLQDAPQLLPEENGSEEDFRAREEKWFAFVNEASNRVMLHFANHLMDHLSGANVFNIFHTIGSAGGLYTLLAPYFVAFSLYNKDKILTEAIHRRFVPTGESKPVGNPHIKVAHFTDTFYEVNGVALTLQQQVRSAQANAKALTIITSYPDKKPDEAGIHNFTPIGVYELPEYPEQKVFYPPFLEMLSYCYEAGFTHVHVATPGPLGLAALAIAKILKLPLSGTYHTAIPQYARSLTGDDAIEDLAWKYMLWFYDQMDRVYAPSESTKAELVEKGLVREKVSVYPRGIDTERFTPKKRNGYLKEHHGISGGLNLLYVGRISKEKNLPLLVEAMRRLAPRHPDLHLVVAGEGPYLEEMMGICEGLPCTFAGYVHGEALEHLYASCDLFVFPSTTDTFGNVVLEAQASGLPVIVTDQGGPSENVIHGKTGLVVSGDDVEALETGMVEMISTPEQIQVMGQAARQYMQARSFDVAFMRTWEMYKSIQPADSNFTAMAGGLSLSALS